jgi:hypothetical protein
MDRFRGIEVVGEMAWKPRYRVRGLQSKPVRVTGDRPAKIPTQHREVILDFRVDFV